MAVQWTPDLLCKDCDHLWRGFRLICLQNIVGPVDKRHAATLRLLPSPTSCRASSLHAQRSLYIAGMSDNAFLEDEHVSAIPTKFGQRPNGKTDLCLQESCVQWSRAGRLAFCDFLQQPC